MPKERTSPDVLRAQTECWRLYAHVGLQPSHRREEHSTRRQSTHRASHPGTTPDDSLESTYARGALCYIDAYTQPDLPRGCSPPPGETLDGWKERLRNTPTHLCRIRYFGNEDRWSFAFYTYSHEEYQPSFLITGKDHGTPEEAFETSAVGL